MHVVVAVGTAFADVAELPFWAAFGQVTGEAGRRHVPTVQREFGFGVLGDTEGAWLETIHRVTFGAIGGMGNVSGKLLLVVVSVAGGTGIVRQRLGVAVRNVAFPAVHCLVFALK